jgi:hypothetical protein
MTDSPAAGVQGDMPGIIPPAPSQPVAPDQASPAGNPQQRRWQRIAAGVTAAVVVAVGAFFGAQALGSHKSTPSPTSIGTSAPGGGAGGRFGPGTSGTVTSVNTGGLTLTDQTGTSITVTTSGSTTVSKTSAGSLNDIVTGDQVTVFASGTAPSLTATRITDSGAQAATSGPRGGFGAGGANRPGGGAAGGVAGTVVQGTVASNDGSTLTVTQSNGSPTSIAVNGSSAVSLTRSIPLSAIAIGDTVRVRGTTSGTTVAATSITDGVTGFGRPGQAANGGGQAPTNG